MKVLKQILVPTDFSDCAKAALSQALVFARKFDAKIVLLHATQIDEGHGPAPESDTGRAGLPAETTEAVEARLKRLLQELSPSLKKAHQGPGAGGHRELEHPRIRTGK